MSEADRTGARAARGRDLAPQTERARRAPAPLRRLLQLVARAFGERLASPQLTPARRELPVPTDAIYAQREPLFRIPLDRCWYPYGFSYASGAWHPFSVTVRQLRREADLGYDASELRRYYDAFQPNDVRELLLGPGAEVPGDDGTLRALQLDEWFAPLPWDPERVPTRGEKGVGARHGHQGYGPVSREKGELELRRLADLLHRVEQRGYQSGLGGRHISGYFLLDGDDYRFVIRSGLHRMSVLSALDAAEVPVSFVPGYPRAIHRAELERWPLVRDGTYSVALAERVFRSYFDDPDAKPRALGLLGPAAPAPVGDVPTAAAGGWRG